MLNRKHYTPAIACALILTLLFSACGKPAVTNSPADYSADFDTVKALTYDNLAFAADVKYIPPIERTEYHSIDIIPPKSMDTRTFFDGFMADLKYYFPDKTIDSKFVFYRSGAGYDSLLLEDIDKIIAENRGYEYFLLCTSGKVQDYDEKWQGPNGNDFYYCKIPNGAILRVNKGKIYNKFFETEAALREKMTSIAAWALRDWIEPYKILPSDSTESYKMFDGKELSIADGAKQVKDYLANVPDYKGKPLKTAVVDTVQVFKLPDGTFCYDYKIVDEYDGIPFDYGDPCSHSPFDYQWGMNIAEICESNDVDMFLGNSTHCDVAVTDTYDKIIPVGQAMAITSEKLTKAVKFEVRQVEVVYAPKYTPTDDYWKDVAAPAWRIICFNPNDNFIYHVYMDAKDGANFRYYTTSADE